MGGLKQDYWQNYVDGNWVDGGAGRLTVENPGTGEPLASGSPVPGFSTVSLPAPPSTQLPST